MTLALPQEIKYPDSDGQPLPGTTLQFRWIFLIKENQHLVFHNNPNVLGAGEFLWFPVDGRSDRRGALDVMVVFGGPKGERGSNRQWQEDNIAPQIVFEVLSPWNTL